MKTLVFLSVLLPCLAAAESIERLIPEAHYPTDPDISKVDDQHLIDLYWRTIIPMRQGTFDHKLAAVNEERAKEGQSAVVLGDGVTGMRGDAVTRLFVEIPKAKADADYIIQAAEDALASNPIQWSKYRTALWAMRSGMQKDPRVLEVARKALQAPRGDPPSTDKISDEHLRAIQDTLEVLGQLNTKAAVDLLFEATTREFWGDDPFHRRRTKPLDSEYEIKYIRDEAMRGIAMTEADLSIPALNKLKVLYPDRSTRPTDRPDYEFWMSRATLVDREIDFINRREGRPDAIPLPWK
ncbi:MAG: hypothetical protein KJ052_11900 [Candidatus Hydrogenedentes bacterium]|nr:hypothetical protein [Candidatus Hydrogenedentota bacterium]